MLSIKGFVVEQWWLEKILTKNKMTKDFSEEKLISDEIFWKRLLPKRSPVNYFELFSWACREGLLNQVLTSFYNLEKCYFQILVDFHQLLTNSTDKCLPISINQVSSKTVDGMLEIWTWDDWMEGTDKSSEPPQVNTCQGINHLSSVLTNTFTLKILLLITFSRWLEMDGEFAL